MIRGHKNSILIRDQSGFVFRQGGFTNSKGTSSWYCQKRTQTKCRAKVVTDGEFIVLQKCEHNH